VQNWLSDRKQRLCVNGIFSEWMNVSSGVPQGSILGPLLFNIFINDIDENVCNKFLKFADDSKLWGQVNTVNNISDLQKDLDVLT
jgi:ribonuclease P/MRP protein subunit RPP40